MGNVGHEKRRPLLVKHLNNNNAKDFSDLLPILENWGPCRDEDA